MNLMVKQPLTPPFIITINNQSKPAKLYPPNPKHATIPTLTTPHKTSMAYSKDFRQQVLRQLAQGKTYRQLAHEYNISTRTILNWTK